VRSGDAPRISCDEAGSFADRHVAWRRADRRGWRARDSPGTSARPSPRSSETGSSAGRGRAETPLADRPQLHAAGTAECPPRPTCRECRAHRAPRACHRIVSSLRSKILPGRPGNDDTITRWSSRVSKRISAGFRIVLRSAASFCSSAQYADVRATTTAFAFDGPRFGRHGGPQSGIITAMLPARQVFARSGRLFTSRIV